MKTGRIWYFCYAFWILTVQILHVTSSAKVVCGTFQYLTDTRMLSSSRESDCYTSLLHCTCTAASSAIKRERRLSFEKLLFEEFITFQLSTMDG